MKKLTLILWTILMVAVAASVAMAQTTSCEPLAEIRAKAMAAHVRLAYVDDARLTQALVAFYNATPPESNESYSTAYIAMFPGGVASVMVGRGDEICGEFKVPTDILSRMMGTEL